MISSIFGEPYFVRHVGLLFGRMEYVRHYNLKGRKMSDTIIWRVGKCTTFFPKVGKCTTFFPKVGNFGQFLRGAACKWVNKLSLD